MTVDFYQPHQPQIIQNSGPFTAPWPILDPADLIVTVLREGEVIELPDGAYAILVGADAQTSIMLDPATLGVNEGALLWMRRRSVIEQGWEALENSRDKGLERQLDRMVKADQDHQEAISRAVKLAAQPMNPVAARPMSVFGLDDDLQLRMFAMGSFPPGPQGDAGPYLMLDDYGAKGDGETDDAEAIMAALEQATLRGGAIIHGTPGKTYAFSGRFMVPRYAFLDMGPVPSGARLLALSDQGGVDLDAGSQIRGRITAAGANDEIGVLAVRTGIMSIRPREITQKLRYDCSLDRLGEGADRHSPGSIGFQVDIPEGGQGSVNWTEGRLEVSGFDRGVWIRAEISVWNSNTLWADIRDFVIGFEFNGLGPLNQSNKLWLQFQTGGGNRAQRAFWARSRFSSNEVYLTVWDFLPQSVDPNFNVMIEWSVNSFDNAVGGQWRDSAGNSPDVEFLDKSTAARPNIVNASQRRTLSAARNIPPLMRQMVGAQDNVLFAAHRRFDVTLSGATPFVESRLPALFDRAQVASLNGCTEAIVTIDMGAPANFTVLGVDFNTQASSVERATIEFSPDGTEWTTVARAGYFGEGVPRLLGRGSHAPILIGGDRYVRFTFESDAPGTNLRVGSLFGYCLNSDMRRRGGEFAPVLNPEFLGNVRVNGRSVLNAPQDVIPPPEATTASHQTTLLRVLDVLESAGLVLDNSGFGSELVSTGVADSAGTGSISFDSETGAYTATRGLLGTTNAAWVAFPATPGQTYRFDIEVLSGDRAEAGVGDSRVNVPVNPGIAAGERKVVQGTALSNAVYVRPRSNEFTSEFIIHSVVRVIFEDEEPLAPIGPDGEELFEGDFEDGAGENLAPGTLQIVGTEGGGSYDAETGIYDLERGSTFAQGGRVVLPTEIGKTYRAVIEVMFDSDHPARLFSAPAANAAIVGAVNPGATRVLEATATDTTMVIVPRTNNNQTRVKVIFFAELFED